MNTKKRTMCMKRIIASLALSAVMIVCSMITASAAPTIVTRQDVAKLIYPVGCYFETSNTSFNPNTAWPGTTWEEITDGRVLIAANSTYANGATGGEATHALTAAETALKNHTHTMDNHYHSIPALSGSDSWVGDHSHALKVSRCNKASGSNNWVANSSGSQQWWPLVAAGGHSHTVSTNASTTGEATATTGNPSSGEVSGSAHNNMMPYLAVKRWHRTS